jgi:hypothetical protein
VGLGEGSLVGGEAGVEAFELSSESHSTQALTPLCRPPLSSSTDPPQPTIARTRAAQRRPAAGRMPECLSSYCAKPITAAFLEREQGQTVPFGWLPRRSNQGAVNHTAVESPLFCTLRKHPAYPERPGIARPTRFPNTSHAATRTCRIP